MSKFAKSAMLPIIIVIVLAFLLSKYMQGDKSKKDYSFQTFQAQLAANDVNKANVDPSNHKISVTAIDQGKEVKKSWCKFSKPGKSPISKRKPTISKKKLKISERLWKTLKVSPMLRQSWLLPR